MCRKYVLFSYVSLKIAIYILVDYNYQGQGIARKMGRAMFRIAWTNHFRTFATVSRNNSRALAAYRAINDFKVVKELPDNYIYIEYLKDKVK